MKSSSAGNGASEARGNVAHEVTADTIWWPNGSSGREIRCVTCQPNRLLWQSPPDVAFVWSEEFFASVAEVHRVAMNAAWESSAAGLLNAKQERKPSLETGLAYEPDDDGE